MRLRVLFVLKFREMFGQTSFLLKIQGQSKTIGTICWIPCCTILETYPEIWILQQHNAPPYTATFSEQFLDEKGIRTLDSARISSDLNAIQHLGDYMERKLQKIEPKYEKRCISELCA